MAAVSRRAIAPALTAAAVLLLDRTTKAWAAAALRGRPPIRIAGGALELLFSENAGGFLSIGAGLPPALRGLLFVGLAGAGLAAAAAWLLLRRPDVAPVRAAAATAVIAGGASNLLDRVARGRVVDFAILRVGPLHTGVFNLADAAILAGAVLLMWPGIRRKGDALADRSSSDTNGGAS